MQSIGLSVFVMCVQEECGSRVAPHTHNVAHDCQRQQGLDTPHIHVGRPPRQCGKQHRAHSCCVDRDSCARAQDRLRVRKRVWSRVLVQLRQHQLQVAACARSSGPKMPRGNTFTSPCTLGSNYSVKPRCPSSRTRSTRLLYSSILRQHRHNPAAATDRVDAGWQVLLSFKALRVPFRDFHSCPAFLAALFSRPRRWTDSKGTTLSLTPSDVTPITIKTERCSIRGQDGGPNMLSSSDGKRKAKKCSVLGSNQ
jgi:hypothetical protein